MDRARSELFGPTAECIPIEQLVAILDQPAISERRLQSESHLASCPFCSAELALFRQFESAQPVGDEQAVVQHIVKRLRRESPVAAVPWWSRLWIPRFIAPAAVALTAALVFAVLNVNRPAQPEAKTDDVVRSAQIGVVGPVGELTAPPTLLQWRTVSGATAYRVRLLEVDHTELWRSTTTSPSLSLPETLKAKLKPPKRLLWDVDALDAAGNTLSSSGLVSFIVEK